MDKSFLPFAIINEFHFGLASPLHTVGPQWMGAESISWQGGGGFASLFFPHVLIRDLTSFRFLSQVPLLPPTFFLFRMIVITLTNVKLFMDTVLRELGTTILVT